MVANPACGRLSTEIYSSLYLFTPESLKVWSPKIISTVRPALAGSFSIPRLNLVLTHGLLASPLSATLFIKLSTDFGSVPSLLGHAIACRWRSPQRIRRHRTSTKVDRVMGAVYSGNPMN